jgi:hypothetical protein
MDYNLSINHSFLQPVISLPNMFAFVIYVEVGDHFLGTGIVLEDYAFAVDTKALEEALAMDSESSMVR